MSELEKMSIEELKSNADALGISYPNNIKQAALIKKINEALGDDEQGEEEDTKAAPGKTDKDDQFNPKLDKTKTVKIIVAADKTNKQPVFVGVNGRSYRIKRGVEVDVPAFIVPTLRNAIQTVKDEETGEMTKVPSYPFQVIG